MRDADTLHKEKNTQYADARCHARENDIKPGDKVFLRQPYNNKF